MEILKSLFRSIVRLVAINIALILFFGLAPLLYLVVPFWFLLHVKKLEVISDMITVYLFCAPFVCAFWMTIVCHWQTVQKARRAGVKDWREAEGGMGRTVAKSFGFWFLGFFGTIAALFVFCHFAHPLIYTATGRLEFFAMAPFAVFAPVWLVLLCRWMRSRKREDFISGSKGDRELREKLHAISLQAKSMRGQNAH
jgi:hypothetical protein